MLKPIKLVITSKYLFSIAKFYTIIIKIHRYLSKILCLNTEVALRKKKSKDNIKNLQVNLL